MIEHPLGDRHIRQAIRQRIVAGRRRADAPVGIREKQGHLTPERVGDMAHRDPLHRLPATRRGQLTAHAIQHRSATLARARHSGLLTYVRSQRRDRQRNDQHDHESHHVLRVRHGKRQSWRNEEEVEAGDVQRGRQRRRTAPQTQPGDGGTEQIHHHEIRDTEERIHDRSEQRADCGQCCGPAISVPADRRGDWQLLAVSIAADASTLQGRVVASGDDREVHSDGTPHQRGAGGRTQPGAQTSTLRFTDDDPRGVAQPRVLDDRVRGRRTVERHGFGAQRFRQPQDLDAPVAGRFAEPQHRRRLHRHDRPLRIEGVGEPLADAHQTLCLVVGGNRNEKAIAREQRTRRRIATRVLARGGIDAIGRAAQRKFAQRNQVWLAEEAIERGARLLGQVHLARLQAFQQIVGREVDQLDLGGFVEHLVRHRLLLTDPGDPGDDIVQAFDVLDVHRRPDIESGLEHLFDVLPALRVPRGRHPVHRIRMCELVDQRDACPASQRGVEIELLAHDAAVINGQRRQPLEPLDQTLGLDTAVRFDIADDDVRPARLGSAGGLEHRVRLANPGGRSEEQMQSAALRARLFPNDVREQLVRVGPAFAVDHTPPASSARFSSRTCTRGSPRRPSVRPCVCLATSASTVAISRPRARATRAT